MPKGNKENRRSTGLGVQGYHIQHCHDPHHPLWDPDDQYGSFWLFKVINVNYKGTHTKGEGFQEWQSFGRLQALSQGKLSKSIREFRLTVGEPSER